MKGLIGRLFWSEEGQARDEARWARPQVWLHPAVWWVVQFAWIAGFVIFATTAGDHGALWWISSSSLLGVSLLVWLVHDQAVRARRRHGWAPTVGIHTRPIRNPGEWAIAMRWRWTVQRRTEPRSNDRPSADPPG